MGEVIDLEAILIRRAQAQAQPLKNPILDALDSLGLALLAHDHKWTDHERALYENAVALLGG